MQEFINKIKIFIKGLLFEEDDKINRVPPKTIISASKKYNKKTDNEREQVKLINDELDENIEINSLNNNMDLSSLNDFKLDDDFELGGEEEEEDEDEDDGTGLNLDNIDLDNIDFDNENFDEEILKKIKDLEDNLKTED